MFTPINIYKNFQKWAKNAQKMTKKGKKCDFYGKFEGILAILGIVMQNTSFFIILEIYVKPMADLYKRI